MKTEKKTRASKKIPQTLKVAITGGAGSGKTSVCKHLISLGMEVISADQVAREIVSPGSPVFRDIVAHF